MEKYRTLVVPLTLLLQAAPLEEADVPSKSPACAEDTGTKDEAETDAADVVVSPLTRAVARREANWAAVNAARLAMVVLCWCAGLRCRCGDLTTGYEVMTINEKRKEKE